MPALTTQTKSYLCYTLLMRKILFSLAILLIPFLFPTNKISALGPPEGYAQSTLTPISCGPEGISFNYELTTTDNIHAGNDSAWNLYSWYTDYEGSVDDPLSHKFTITPNGMGGTYTVNVNPANYVNGDTVTVTSYAVFWQDALVPTYDVCLYDPAYEADPTLNYCGHTLSATCTYNDPGAGICVPNISECDVNTQSCLCTLNSDCCSNYCDPWGYCTDTPLPPPGPVPTPGSGNPIPPPYFTMKAASEATFIILFISSLGETE